MAYAVKMIHPQPAAEFVETVKARSAEQARTIALLAVKGRFGWASYYAAGDATKLN